MMIMRPKSPIHQSNLIQAGVGFEHVMGDPGWIRLKQQPLGHRRFSPFQQIKTMKEESHLLR
jgi:hypothetical protein